MAVMVLSGIMYTRLGLSNTDLALYTSWLYLPWVIKPLWSPLVDGVHTKRWWILSMQCLVGAALGGVALSLHAPQWLQLSLLCFWLMAFGSATHDIAADGFYILGLSEKAQALYVGVRSTFYRVGSIFCQGLLVMLAGWLERHASVPLAWSLTLLLLGGLMLGLAGWHGAALPRVEVRQAMAAGWRGQLREFRLTIQAFFSRPRVWAAVLFMLFFRFPEAQLAKMAQPFMLRPLEDGGLALSTSEVGFIYGTVGVLFLLAGGLLGGWLVSLHGLRRWFWPMVMAISIPDAVYVFFALYQPQSPLLLYLGVGIEQLGYGLGFTAYTLYLVHFSRGARSTSVFSLCTAFQALGMMLPGMLAGWLADRWGFTLFFSWVCFCCLLTFAVSALLRLRDLEDL